MKQYEILEALATSCPFPEVFTEIENPGERTPKYRRKIGHLRADYDGWRWWNTWWIAHEELNTPENIREIDGVYDALTSADAFKDLNALRQFCRKHPEAAANDNTAEEYNFYLEGVFCWYWLRLITRKGDYNLYLHTFVKEEDPDTQRMFNALDGAENPTCETLRADFPEMTEEAAAAMICRWERRFRLGPDAGEPAENAETPQETFRRMGQPQGIHDADDQS